MDVLDFVSSIPYRIAGVIVMLLCVVLSIPFIIIPTLLGLITNNMTIKEAYSTGMDILGEEYTLNELFEALDSGDWYTKMVKVALDKALLGFALILGGIYYKEFYDYALDK